MPDGSRRRADETHFHCLGALSQVTSSGDQLLGARKCPAVDYNRVEGVVGSEHNYVEERDGGLFVAGSRISLASIISEFREGASPETIRQNFPALSLPQVYGAIAFFLNHPEQSEEYLRDLKGKWADLERSARPLSVDVQQRIEEARNRLLAEQR